MTNLIKTPQQMLLEQAGIPHLAGGNIVAKELTAGARMLVESAIKKFKAVTGRSPTANEVAQIEQHAASLSQPTTKPSKLSPEAQEANLNYLAAKNPNYTHPDDVRDPFVVRQMMPGRTKAGTAQPTLTESIGPKVANEAEVEGKVLSGELFEPKAAKSVEESTPTFDPLAHVAEDTPLSEIKWSPSTTPSSDYMAQMSEAQIGKALGEKAIGRKDTVYEMLRDNFTKENGRAPTADEMDALIVKFNPARHPYGESELTRYESGEGLDLLPSRPKTARGMEDWIQANRDLGVSENYLKKQVDKYPKEYQDALQILSGELPFSKVPTPRKKKAAGAPESTHLDEEGNIVKVYPANKKAGGAISAERMRHAMLANGKTPQKFAKGNSVQEDTVYDPMGGVVYVSGANPESTKGATKTAAKVLHNVAALPVAAGMNAANTMAGTAQLFGYDEPAKAIKQTTTGLKQRAPVGAAIGEFAGDLIDPVTMKLLGLGGGAGKQFLYGTGQGYLAPMEGEDTGPMSLERIANALAAGAFNSTLYGIPGAYQKAKKLIKRNP